MNNTSITARTTATASAAFIATMTGGYFNVDALIAVEQAKEQRIVATTPSVVVKSFRTAGGLNFFKSFQKSSFRVADSIPTANVRNVTRVEDLILRRATLRAGRVISKGRFVSK